MAHKISKIFVDVNLDLMSKVQDLYDEYEEDGDDEVMDWYIDRAEKAIQKLQGKLLGDIEFEGERGGFFATFTFEMPYTKGDKENLKMEELFGGDTITPDDDMYDNMYDNMLEEN